MRSKEEKKKWADYMREYQRKRTPEQKADASLWSKWRIRFRDYNAILKSQGGGCAICGAKEDPCTDKKSLTGNKRLMAVDHVHHKEPLDIRGILCTDCNTALGRFKDNKDYLMNAIHYLNRDLHKIKREA